MIKIRAWTYDDDKNRIALQSILQRLGGENDYPWGKIELEVDLKGGDETVLIKYK